MRRKRISTCSCIQDKRRPKDLINIWLLLYLKVNPSFVTECFKHWIEILADLKSGLFAEPEEADVVRLADETARSVEAARHDRLAPDLGHDVALAAQVFVAQWQEVVDDERWNEASQFELNSK